MAKYVFASSTPSLRLQKLCGAVFEEEGGLSRAIVLA